MAVTGAPPPEQPPEQPEAPPVTTAALVRPSAWSTTFASLRERDYAWFFAGNVAFFMGMQMQFILRGFLAFELTNAATALGIISASIAFPMLVVAPFAGVVADRMDKRMLLILTQSFAAVASLITAVLIIGEWIEFWHLIVVSLATALVFTFNMPARQALVPQLVPQHKLMNAISLQMGGMNLTRIIAPAVAGVLIAPIGIGYVYLLTFFLFALATASELKLPRHGMRARPTGATFFGDFAEGFAYIGRHRLIAVLIFTSLIAPLFGFPVQQILPVFSENVFGTGAIGLGLLASATGIGGLAGAILSANMDRRPEKGLLMLAGGVVMGAFLVAFALTSDFLLALVFLGLANIGQMLFMATNNTLIQATVPEEVRGRVMSVMMMSFGLMPLGVLPISIAADAYGASATVAVSSLLLLVVLGLIFGLSSPLRGLRQEALEQASMSPAQAAALVAEGRLSQEEADRLTGRRHFGDEPSRDGASVRPVTSERGRPR
jgi:MFS family permease